ncbi:two-component regulator propeller domain-containing protein [uncultured Aquimarina sp.]|uniref:ligand-binding sensor domain-containing protein n=1 Tax=uncultured Aquimarina sp. TaxID=575652 RepID=UPI0026162DA0|nr:two-component regulator propeller domain-containing protein [uncultured Aquimarina sp.]
MSPYRFSYIALISFIWICSIHLLSAQNNGLRAYTLEDGLPQSQVHDIIQDDIGYLWLGTRGGGLSRFNGEEFETWNEDDGLLSNYIHSLHFANDSLFIGTRKGLSIKTKKQFHNIEGLQINKIFKIHNKTYLATNVGIHKYEPASGLKKILLDPKINTSIVNDIVFDGKLFWIATNKGLWKLNKIHKDASIIERHSAYNFTSALYHKSKVFAAATNQGILVLNTNAKSYGNKWIPKPLNVNNISILDTELWFSTSNEGITVLDAKNYRLKKKINRKNGLAVSNIRKSISDRQSNIWIATSGGGFYKYSQNNFTHYNQDTGLKGNRVYAVHITNNEIWASNSEEGLIKIDSTGIHQIEQDKRLSDIKIKTITSDNKGNIWAGTEGKGILFKEIKLKDSIVITNEDSKNPQRDTLTKKVIKNYIINKKRGLSADWIRSIHISNDTVWAATHSSGITRFRYDYKKHKVRSIRKFNKKRGLKDLEIKHMTSDGNGKIWYATENGSIGFIKKNKVTHYSNILEQKIAINTFLFKDKKIYVGTAGQGIWWSNLDKGALSFKKLEGEKNLYSNNIYQMIFDNEDNLWVGTERGVDRIEINLLNQITDILHYGRNDGFLGIETCLNAIAKDTKGNLWFGAIYGLTKYEPGETNKATIKPEIHFENVEIAYQTLDSINPDIWAKNDNILLLTPEQTELSFSYKTIDLNHPKDIEYRYKLNNTAWSPWSSERKQNLAGLAYGPHSFSAQSRNYRWEESQPITFKIFIDSPIYKKIWFLLTMLGVLLLVLTVITLLYIRKVKLKNSEEREKLQMQNHLLSLEQKALRLQMNPHFIFNVLNGIKAMGTSNPSKMNSTINTFATLLRETLYNSRKDHITLDQEMKTLKHYIEVEKLMANKSFDYTISIDSEFDPEEVLIPPMLIQPFVENAIRHGILKGNREGKLKVFFDTNEEFLHCKILDNGLGIFQSQKAKTKTDHQSMALTVTRERLESISGKDSLQIKEILEEDTSVAGTEISFKIPLLTDY